MWALEEFKPSSDGKGEIEGGAVENRDVTRRDDEASEQSEVGLNARSRQEACSQSYGAESEGVGPAPGVEKLDCVRVCLPVLSYGVGKHARRCADNGKLGHQFFVISFCSLRSAQGKDVLF